MSLESARNPRRKPRAPQRLAALVLAIAAAVVPAAVSATAVHETTLVAADVVFPDGTFESHLDGFTGSGATRVLLSRDGAGRNGTRAMTLRTSVSGPVDARSTQLFAGANPQGTRYQVRAWVSGASKTQAVIEVGEVAGGTVVQTRVSPATIVVRGEWKLVAVDITTTRADSVLELRVRSPYLQSTRTLRMDDLRIDTVLPPSSGGGLLSNGCSYTVQGLPECGVYVGAAHGSNTDPTTMEGQLGGNLGVRRTYFTGTGVTKAVDVARADIAAGRLPWISFKLPYSWGEMAAGAGDAWARDLTSRLAALDGPVWIAFHHEPEGDGDIQQWRRMQERLAPIVQAAGPNLAFTVIVTGWHQFYGAAEYRLSEIWPRGVKVDVAGFDIYQQYGVVKDGQTTTKWTDFSEYFRQISAWAATVGVDWGLAETGVTDRAAVDHPSEIPDTVDLMGRYGGIAYTYFDTTLNSVAPWDLSPAGKFESFKKALTPSPTMVP